MKLEVMNGVFSYTKSERIILNNINFTLNSGDVLAVLGPNGAGKTTLLRCMLGFMKWKRGVTLIDGEEISHIPQRRLWQRVSYVPQVRQAPVAYTVEDMILLGRAGEIGSFSTPRKKDMKAVDSAIQKTNLEYIRHRSCAKLSGGEYQMVLIARALASEPELIVFDEPESNLDFQNQLLVLNLISQLSRDGITCVFNTHYPAHALRWSNKALMLSKDGTYYFGNSREVVTEENIAQFFGVSAVIGSLETAEGMYPDVIPVEIGSKTYNNLSGEESVIAGITVLMESAETADKLNHLLHEYGEDFIGRMGIPYRKVNVNIISLMMDAPLNRVLSLTDRLSALPGTHVKTTYISAGGRNG
ncbi:MAG TPA: TM1266 family iron-only hydrogenase system putative regulator [Parasegetibacter sp.]|jgi:iron complex transport system ATP-binding protein